jgi:hypothetical protein
VAVEPAVNPLSLVPRLARAAVEGSVVVVVEVRMYLLAIDFNERIYEEFVKNANF